MKFEESDEMRTIIEENPRGYLHEKPVEHLEAQPNKQGYIRSLIKKDMDSGK